MLPGPEPCSQTQEPCSQTLDSCSRHPEPCSPAPRIMLPGTQNHAPKTPVSLTVKEHFDFSTVFFLRLPGHILEGLFLWREG